MALGLSDSSRSRRRLILRQLQSVEASPSYSRLAAVRRTLAQSPRATWVFTGEDAGRLHAEKITLGQIFETEVREVQSRMDDVIVDSTRPRDRLVALWQGLHQRVLRFEPAAAFLMLGAGDPRSARVKHETVALARVAQVLQQKGCTPVLLPPPRYMLGDAAAIERQRRRATLVAEQFSLPLVDISQSRRPSDAGRLLLGALGFDVECDVKPVPQRPRGVGECPNSDVRREPPSKAVPEAASPEPTSVAAVASALPSRGETANSSSSPAVAPAAASNTNRNAARRRRRPR